jgi:hypothetical protein
LSKAKPFQVFRLLSHANAEVSKPGKFPGLALNQENSLENPAKGYYTFPVI